ncbi:hypothetical protein HNP84_002825 [Thermocatellispora tengchongensis]|uniref:Septum formation initiator n=1 Tax=Thermocatellispora tengchongensis TaxID=1073253 RepID=A0A840NWA1_9ACTN|nr:septum formation initiator [Thermocatellispora tengchongensis]MBB5133104.1 hypothetical protein [Thermocatellispora tengchongensis]
MRRRLALAAAGWAVTAALATGAGVGVINLLGESLSGPAGRPLSAEDVRRELAAAPPASPTAAPTVTTTPTTTPTPSATATPTIAPTPPAVSEVIESAGGTVIARCAGGLAELRSWNPAQGYQVDDVERGPAARARIEFEADDGDDDSGRELEVKMEIRCGADGHPVAHTRAA